MGPEVLTAISVARYVLIGVAAIALIGSIICIIGIIKDRRKSQNTTVKDDKAQTHYEELHEILSTQDENMEDNCMVERTETDWENDLILLEREDREIKNELRELEISFLKFKMQIFSRSRRRYNIVKKVAIVYLVVCLLATVFFGYRTADCLVIVDKTAEYDQTIIIVATEKINQITYFAIATISYAVSSAAHGWLLHHCIKRIDYQDMQIVGVKQELKKLGR